MRTPNRFRPSSMILGIGMAALAATACGSTATAEGQEASSQPTSNADEAGLPALVGAWDVTVSPEGWEPFTNFVVYASDGTAVSTDNAVGTGIGAWEQTEDGRFAIHLTHLATIVDPDGSTFYDRFVDGDDRLGYVDVRITASVSEDGRTMTGTYRTDFLDRDRVVATPARGRIEATRMTAR